MKYKIQISILMLLVITLGITPLEFSYAQNEENGEYETHYFLDTGVIFIWKHSNGTWQKNIKPNDIYKGEYNLTLMNIPHGREIKAEDIQLVDVKVYNPNLYSFDQENFRRWINPKALNEIEYISRFIPHTSNNIRITDKSYSSTTGKVSVKYEAELVAIEQAYDVKNTIEQIAPQEVYEYLGGEEKVSREMPEIKKAIEILKPSKFSSNVEGYMYFVPTVIEYKVKKAPQGNDTTYIFSGFNTNRVTQHDPRDYTFWMFRPKDAHPELSDEFLVEGHSWTFQDKDYIQSEKFPIKHFKLDKDNQVVTYNLKADFVPIRTVIWRKGKEHDKYKYHETFKDNFWAGYIKEYNGEAYYYYDTWNAEADGEFYPLRLLDNYPDEVVQEFLNEFGYTKELWLEEPWFN
jgi:hypothetical protein